MNDPLDETGPGGGNTIDAARSDTSGAGEGTGGAADGGTDGATEGDTPTTGPDAGTGTTDSGADADGGAQGEGGQDGGSGNGNAQDDEGQNIALQLIQPFQDAARYVPDSIKAALAALAALSILLGFGYLLSALRARRLARQRRELLQEVGLLQSALLPPVPDKVGALRTSVAYRPADGPGAGGDFYDVLPLPGGRVGFILGDVSGHGRGALARTAFMRYTLRAYLEAGLEPRVALQVAGRVIDDNLGGDFATVLLAVHDPETGSLTYATAGHPAPIVVGPQPHEPVTAGSSPPIGVGVRTGLRQTTVPLVPGSVACLFTDGLMEARTEDGILGRERLAELLDDLGDEASARRLIERVAAESSNLSDDMAAVIVSPTAGVTAGLFRTEQLELSSSRAGGPDRPPLPRGLRPAGLRGRGRRARRPPAGRPLRRRGPARGLRQPAARGGAPAQRGVDRGRLAPRQRRKRSIALVTASGLSSTRKCAASSSATVSACGNSSRH